MSAAAIGTRRVEPEWLDTLPPLDPRARRSRRDLVRVNALMGHARIVAGELARHLAPGARTIVEVGAGDGAFALALSRTRQLGAWCPYVTLVDRQPCADGSNVAAIRERGWQAAIVQGDAFDWLAAPRARPHDAIVANLFLHHFESEALARLLALAAQRTRLFVACEPRRSAFALAGASLLGAAGCNDVTRHDAVVSVRAGFSGAELAGLWPKDRGWHIEEGPRGLFSHVFVARLP
jgi:hypothetical protein